MASSQRSQEYHHFVPQFILRNFSHAYSPSPNGHRSGRRKKNKKTGLYPGDPVLSTIDLKAETAQLSESPVKRTFGMMDMYRDISKAADQYYLEKEIGKLESQVSVTIAGIRKALESGQNGFSMTRHQRNVLRKFLFIMKYRGMGFHRRFHGNKSGNYVEDDKYDLEKYMQEKGYKKPVDVWFRSIKAILELKMDLKGEWRKKLLTEIFPNDALWFIAHTQCYFLAFCTPNDPNDEFVLTENCYNIYEGPNSFESHPDTREQILTAWTSYHEFSPITPKLMLVLRSLMLPNSEEDANEGIKEWRREFHKANIDKHNTPATSDSILKDLPIKKPRNSYSQVTAEGIQLLPGEDGSPRSSHRFTFPFFKISTDQVHKINSILLDNAHLTSKIAFDSKSSLKSALEYYLRLPVGQGFRVIHDQESDIRDTRLSYLKKLESVVNSLGSGVKLTYTIVPGIDDINKAKKKLEQLQKKMLEHMPQEPTEFMQLHIKLGGGPDTIFTDMDQVGKMRFLRIKIDVLTQGRPEAMREKVRNNLRDLFCQNVPPRRLWLYLKALRGMSLGSPENLKELYASDDIMNGPEDIIVKASHIVRPECLGLLLHFTVMQDIAHRRDPGFGPSSGFTLDAAGAQRLRIITRLTFSPVGNICNCGIEPIQKAAITTSNMLRFTGIYKESKNPVWSVDMNIEILTRLLVRKDWGSLLAGKLPEDTLQELSDVLFNIVYPTYAEPLEE